MVSSHNFRDLEALLTSHNFRDLEALLTLEVIKITTHL